MVKPTIEELETILNSGEEFPYEILPNGELVITDTLKEKLVITDTLKEKLVELRAEVAELRSTNGRMAEDNRCLRAANDISLELDAPAVFELAALRAEVERLRAALEKAVEMLKTPRPVGSVTHARSMISAALRGNGE